MQSGRLFEILYLLLEKRKITASVLAKRFEVSERTIYRDVDVLSAAGIPIYTSRGKGGGIFLLDHYILNKSLLSEQEQKEILYALKGFSATRAGGSEILGKISALFQKNSGDWIDIDFSTWGGGQQEQDKFSILKTAVLENRRLSFLYDSSFGVRSLRLVEPYKLCFKGRTWYLQAFCLEKQDFRTFRVSRMDELQIQEVTFIPNGVPPLLDKEAVPADQILELELRISHRMAYRVHDEFDCRFVTKENGAFSVRAWYPENNWVYGYLLSFGEDLQVISPPHIRHILQEKAEKTAALYKSPDTI